MIELLQTFENGSTDYVAKHNANVALLQGWIQVLFDRTNSQALTSATLGTDAMFGAETAFIGYDSYSAAIDPGNLAHLLIGPGYCYRFSRHQAVTNTVAETVLDFTAQTSGTYYIRASSAGNPEYSLDSTDALWSVAWSGTTLSSLTRIARTVWGASDWLAAQESEKFGETFYRLVDRLDRIEGFFRTSPSWQHLGVMPSGDQVLLRYIATEPFDLPEDLPGSFFRLEDPPADGTHVQTIAKRTSGTVTDIGSATFEIGETEASAVSLPGGVHFDEGDELLVIWPSDTDSNAAGPYGSIKGIR